MHPNNHVIAFLVFLGCICGADALDCYQCVSLAETAVTVPGHQELGDGMKRQLDQQFNNEACKERTGTLGIQLVTCPDIIEADVYCTSADMRMRMHFVVTNEGEKYDVTMSFRLRSRGCSYTPKGFKVTKGCQDSKPYQAMIEKMVNETGFASQNEFRLTFVGPLCICDETKCNTDLPPKEPGSLPTDGGSANIPALCSVLVCLLVFCLFSS